MSRQILKDRGAEGTVGVEPLGQRLAVEQQVPPELLGFEEWEVGLGEAQGTADRDVVMTAAIQGVALEEPASGRHS